MPSESHESPVITQSEDRTDNAVVWLTWGSVALIACSLAVLITAPFELWALLALVFAAAAAVVALFARRRAIRLRRKRGLMTGLVVFIAALILGLYSLPWTIVGLAISLS
ncbi:hypothetical protein [Microbacterium luticocti]|uniref:hypothetical protein n=1 Tax=Microbacterium luticocti TaxID=451764 RepID=UPI00049013DB|nr:hypothetical protein [Microbacterium luticocti]